MPTVVCMSCCVTDFVMVRRLDDECTMNASSTLSLPTSVGVAVLLMRDCCLLDSVGGVGQVHCLVVCEQERVT